MSQEPHYLREVISQALIEFYDLEPLDRRVQPNDYILEYELMPVREFIGGLLDTNRCEDARSFQLLLLSISTSDAANPSDGNHQDAWVPYGRALVAYLYPEIAVQKKLHLDSNVGLRLLVATSTKDSNILDLLSYDRCMLVREQVAQNNFTSEKTRSRLGVLIVSPAECGCHVSEASDACEDFFQSKGLDVPAIHEGDRTELREFHEWQWATQPYPLPIQDYMLESVEYLKGPVPDQYAINHEGHGINSYSLNFRCASGEIAIMAQSAWGGAFGDETKDTEDWNELCMRLTSILVQAFQEDSSEIRIRKYLLVYSSFRFENDFQLLERKGSQWQENNSFSDFDDACRYIIEQNQ
jgi:hypothetical protein